MDGMKIMHPRKYIMVTRVNNGWRIIRGHASNIHDEEYVATDKETVLKLMDEHCEAENPVNAGVETVSAPLP